LVSGCLASITVPAIHAIITNAILMIASLLGRPKGANGMRKL